MDQLEADLPPPIPGRLTPRPDFQTPNYAAKPLCCVDAEFIYKLNPVDADDADFIYATRKKKLGNTNNYAVLASHPKNHFVGADSAAREGWEYNPSHWEESSRYAALRRFDGGLR